MRCHPALPSVAVLLLLSARFAAAQEAETQDYGASERSHWSLQDRSRPTPPGLGDRAQRDWIESPVDAFILEKLSAAGLKPSPEADRTTLVRRLYLHLTGLPPTPDQIDAFLSDRSADAYSRLVDRLLASPRYGEHWGQHWLDVVRYAETEGFEYDRHRAGAWRFRDYVIRSFNADKPYDRFVTEQLAGDELVEQAGDLSDAQRHDALVAVGFHRLGPVRRNAGNTDVAFSRNEVLTERTNMIGSAFLGLTVGCARCHDHMFDAIRQKDYYQLQAFLAGTREHDIQLADAAKASRWNQLNDRLNAEIKEIREQIESAQGLQREKLVERLKAAQARLPKPLPTISSIKNDQPSEIYVLTRGDTDTKEQRVGPGYLGVLLREGASALTPRMENPRTLLARWITDDRHPLTARVIVNRIWHYHFGAALVGTPNDFGVNGEVPSHAELLDFLANQLVEGGWRIKPIHRLILTSSTYRQSCDSPSAAQGREKDPANRLLWHYRRRRLSAEQLRDAMLAISGNLNGKAGGASVIVPVEQELVDLLYKPSQWEVTADPSEHYRRSVYLIAKRNLRLPLMDVFDQPDLQTSCPSREASTHPPQALELLNGEFSNQLAEAFAQRLSTQAGDDPRAQVELAFRLTIGRRPRGREKELALEFVRQQPLKEFALAMFNLNSFLYVE